MEGERESCERVRKKTRREILEKKKASESRMKAASSVKDHLTNFPHFLHYRGNGLYAHLESGQGNRLPVHTKQYIQNLLKLNMEAPFGPEWPDEEKIKRRDMVAPEARYIFVHEILNEDADKVSEFIDVESKCSCKGLIVGFVHYRFVLEEEVPVVYVYELQLEHRVQGKGLGKFLMQLIELIACQNGMGAVVLTVQRANLSAMDFYISKLSWDQREIMRYSVKRLTMKLSQYWRLPKIPQPTHETPRLLMYPCSSVLAHMIVEGIKDSEISKA